VTTPAGSIGEADVRIVADTSRFREEVEAAIASVGDAEVRVRPDMTGFRTAVNNMTRGMTANIRLNPLAAGFKQKVNALTRGMEANIRLNPLATGFRQKVNTLTGGFEANIRLNPIAAGFKQKVNALTSGIEANIRLNPVATGFRTKVNALTRGMEAGIRLRPLAAGFRAQVNALTRGMPPATVRVRCVSIGGNPCGNGRGPATGGRRSGGDGGGDGDITRNANRTVRQLGRIQSAFATLGGIVGRQSAALGYAIAALVVLLAPLAGLIYAIPGAAAAAAAAFILWKKRGDELKESFGGLKDAINDALNTPVGTAALNGAFEAVNRIITEFEKFFRTQEGIQLVADSFKILEAVAKGFGDAVGPAMEGIAAVVANTLPLWERMGEAIGAAGEKFGEFLKNASAGGEGSDAFEAMSNGMRAFGDILELVGGLLGLFGELFKPMADGTHVATEAITGLLEVLEPLAKGLGEIGGVLLEAFGEALKIITALLEPFMPLIEQLLTLLGEQLSKVLDALVPAFQPVIEAFAQVAAILTPMVEGPLTDLIEILGQALADAITQLAPLIAQLATTFVDLWGAVGPLVIKIMELAITALPPLVSVLTKLIGVAVQVITQVLKIISAVAKAVTAFGRWAKETPAVKRALELVKGAISGVVGVLKTLFEWAGKALGKLKDIGGAIKDFGKGALNKIPGVNLASGGIIAGPTKALVGEAGPEVVIPLTRPQRAAELAEKAGLMELMVRSGAASGGRVAPRDVAVHIHTAASQNDIIVHRMQRALAAALAA
jgi:phage-related protein